MASNSGFEFRGRVRAAGRGRAALQHLVLEFTHSSESEWRARIEADSVLVDGVPCRAEQILRAGQVLTWCRPPWEEPEAPLHYALVHEDEHLLAVDKPSGLPTLPGGGFVENTLHHLVRQRFPDASVAHRLGRFTSGLVVFGRSSEARRNLACAFRERRVHKRYLALAAGLPAVIELEVRIPIGPVPHQRAGTIHAANPAGREAFTRVRVLEQREDHFVADVFPVTGRPHQIRIHLAAAGHPLVGDPIYEAGGLPIAGCRALPGDPGYFLHARALRLDHPVTGDALVLEAPGREPAWYAGW